MELYDYVCIWYLCFGILTQVVAKQAIDLPLEWEDFSNRDVCVLTSHFLVLIFAFCFAAYFYYLLLDRKTKLCQSVWAILCILHILILMVDSSEVDARTGVPLQEEAGARQIIQDAVINNNSFKETMIQLVQYARPRPEAKNCPLNVDILLSYRCHAINVSTLINNIMLAIHFLVITDDHFMIVF